MQLVTRICLLIALNNPSMSLNHANVVDNTFGNMPIKIQMQLETHLQYVYENAFKKTTTYFD